MTIPFPLVTACGLYARSGLVVLAVCVFVLSGAGTPCVAWAQQNTGPMATEVEQPKDSEPETFGEWMAKAREGDPKAQCNVGIFYVNGDSVPLNVRQGVEWLRRSADQGFSYAQYVLAEIYTSGESDLDANTQEAYFWASISAAATDLPDKVLSKAAKLRDLNQDRLTQDKIRAVQDKTAAWWAAHASKP